jgi:Protein of unknown function (DUF3631)
MIAPRRVWTPLLAIAELADDSWAQRAREAAIVLSSGQRRLAYSDGADLLAAIRRVFEARELAGLDDHDRIPSSELLRELAADEESSRAEWWDHERAAPGRGAARKLAQSLREFEIASKTIRFAGRSRARGYLRTDFEDAFERYVPSLSEAAESVTSMTAEQAPPLSGSHGVPGDRGDHKPDTETGAGLDPSSAVLAADRGGTDVTDSPVLEKTVTSLLAASAGRAAERAIP